MWTGENEGFRKRWRDNRIQSIATRVLSVVLCIFSRWQTKSVWLFYFGWFQVYLLYLKSAQVKCHTLLVCHLEKIHNSAACYYVKRSRKIYEKANRYNEDSFRLNVSKNGSKRLKKKPARPRSSIGWSHITKQCACSTSGAIILPPFLRLRVDGRKRFEYATCGRKFFQKRRKKPPFSKISVYVWTGPYLQLLKQNT